MVCAGAGAPSEGIRLPPNGAVAVYQVHLHRPVLTVNGVLAQGMKMELQQVRNNFV